MNFCFSFKYRFRFWQWGRWIEVKVDDRLPTRGDRPAHMVTWNIYHFWANSSHNVQIQLGFNINWIFICFCFIWNYFLKALCTTRCILGRTTWKSLCQIIWRICIFKVWNNWKSSTRFDWRCCSKCSTIRSIIRLVLQFYCFFHRK